MFFFYNPGFPFFYRGFADGFDNLEQGIVLHPGNEPYLLLRPLCKEFVMVVSLIKHHHAVRIKCKIVQELAVVDFGCRYFYELAYILQGINEHVYLQSPLFLATILGVAANTFKYQAAEKLDSGRIDNEKLFDVETYCPAGRQKC